MFFSQSHTLNDLTTNLRTWRFSNVPSFLRPRPHVSVSIWKSNFFFTHTASVHTYPMKSINENATFRKRSPEWSFLKTLFLRVRVDRRKRNLPKTLRSQYQFHATPRNIRNLFPFLSFNTYASSMRSRVSFRFEIDSLYIRVDGRKRWENATGGREFFWKRRKKVAFPYEYVWTGPSAPPQQTCPDWSPLAFKNANFLTCNTVPFIFESTPSRCAFFCSCVYIAV